MARPTATQNRALIIEVNYCYYAIPLTPEVEAALPGIFSFEKVNHDYSNKFKVGSDRPDLRMYIGEVEE